MKKYLLVTISIIISSCSPKINTYVLEKNLPLKVNEKIVVYEKDQNKPEKSKVIATTKLGDSGFTTKCDYNTMLEIAKNEARKVGGNAIKITEHILPSVFGSSCHRIKADILKVESFELLTEIKKDSLPKSNVIKVYNDEKTTNISTGKKYSKFILNASVGAAFRVGATPDGLTNEQKEYIKKLKSGTSYDFSTYYVKNETGFGIKYNVYNSDGLIANQSISLNDGTVIKGDFTDNIKISYIGPSMIYSQNEDSKVGEANMEFSLGYISYQNNSTIIGQPIKVTGSNLGAVGGFGYHFRIVPNFLIGGQINFIGGVLKRLKYTYADGTTETVKLNEEELENLWRIDLAIGAKFRF